MPKEGGRLFEHPTKHIEVVAINAPNIASIAKVDEGGKVMKRRDVFPVFEIIGFRVFPFREIKL